MRNRLLNLFAERGTLIDPEATSYLLDQKDPIDVAQRLLSNLEDGKFIITLEDIKRAENIADRAARSSTVQPSNLHGAAQASRPSPKPRYELADAKDYDPEVKVVRDVSGQSRCTGKIEDFSRYFRARFETLREMLTTKRALRGSIDIERAKKLARSASFIGMVNNVRTTRAGHVLLEVEDMTDQCTVLLPADSPLVKDPIVPDEVVGIVGTSRKDGLVIAEDLIHPDVPRGKKFTSAEIPLSAAFVSDTHVGSITFLKKRWNRFIDWLNDSDELAKSVKYLVVNGDTVDGIGIYPRQDEELEIHDIYEQYEELGRLMEDIPDHVQVIHIPGNHDAVRPAEPQPNLSLDLQKLFPSGVMFVGNPSCLELHGVTVLAYHGKSLDDFVAAIPGMSYDTPLIAMREMLRKRHLAPIYGGKTSIAPEPEDHLIIHEVPDIFVTGHVHAAEVDEYRGVLMINSSTWQDQTSYQRTHNYNPVPGRVPIVNLATGDWTIKEF